jgi:hypothetical protein
MDLLLAPHGLIMEDSVPSFLTNVNGELAKSWGAVSNFCTLINFAASTAQRISTNTFLHAMTSIMYRLISMQFPTSPFNEMIRLGLLAFSTSIFLQWKSIGATYPNLISTFKKQLTLLMESNVSAKLDLWLMMVGAVSILDEKDDWWLRPLFVFNASVCQIETWEDMRKLVKDFLWVGLVHDKPGQRVLERLLTAGNVNPHSFKDAPGTYCA